MPGTFRAVDRAAEITFDPANTGLAATDVQGAVDSLNAIVAQGGNANAQGTWLVSGGGVAWTGGYTYRVSAAQFYIAGIAHTSAQTDLTLSAPDGTFNRFDIIAAKSDGTVVVLTGTPASAPELPDTDPLTYLTLTIVRVDTGTSAPAAASSSTVYAENLGTPTEWTGTTSGSGLVLGSTNNPHGGTKDVEGTSVANGSYVEFTTSPAVDVTAKTNLVFYLRNKAAWPSQKSLSVTFRSSTAQVGSAVSVSNGFFGFSSSNTSAYQQIVIPIAQFSIAAGTTATKLRIAVTGGGASVGFYLDDVTLQGGTATGGATGITQQQADARYAQRSANLSDLTDASAARTNLGIATSQVQINSHYGAITADADGATITFALATTDKHAVTLGGNRTLALSGGQTGQTFLLALKQDGTGSRTVTWWSGILWPGGTAPTLTTAAGKTDVFTFLQTGVGTYYGFTSGLNL